MRMTTKEKRIEYVISTSGVVIEEFEDGNVRFSATISDPLNYAAYRLQLECSIINSWIAHSKQSLYQILYYYREVDPNSPIKTAIVKYLKDRKYLNRLGTCQRS